MNFDLIIYSLHMNPRICLSRIVLTLFQRRRRRKGRTSSTRANDKGFFFFKILNVILIPLKWNMELKRKLQKVFWILNWHIHIFIIFSYFSQYFPSVCSAFMDSPFPSGSGSDEYFGGISISRWRNRLIFAPMDIKRISSFNRVLIVSRHSWQS